MKSVEIRFTKGEVNRAGDIFRDPASARKSQLWAADVLSNWRAAHNYPINTFQSTLRSKLKAIDQDALVAQRLKRIPSIIDKLRRFPDMQLSRMQDIGGLRAVVQTLRHAKALHANYVSTRFSHELVGERDYIAHPKPSGYRSIHLVYRYRNERVPQYDGLLLELQIRTRRQHAWATAVETVGIFLNSALKSSEGPGEWLEFFALVGSAFAHLERQPPVPGYEHKSPFETYRAVHRKALELRVHDRLTNFGIAIDAIHSDERQGSYYLLMLDPIERSVHYRAYSRDRFDEATSDYLDLEERIGERSKMQVVLVSTASVEALRRAYPNFFLDTREFLKILGNIARTVLARARVKKVIKKRS